MIRLPIVLGKSGIFSYVFYRHSLSSAPPLLMWLKHPMQCYPAFFLILLQDFSVCFKARDVEWQSCDPFPEKKKKQDSK